MQTKPSMFAFYVALLALMLMMSRAQAGEVSFAWDAPTTNTDGTLLTDLAGYTFYFWQTTWDVPGSVEAGTQTTYTLTDLTVGQSYSFAVTAYNTDGRESAYSNIVTATIPPATGNTAPQAVADAATTAEDTAATIAVMANDTDPDGDALTITAVTQGAHGTATTNGNSVTYAPATNFNGADTFSYTLSDGHGGAATATVSVTITPRNDAPLARADTASTAEDTPVTITTLANDTDPDGNVLTITAVTQGAHGTVTTNSTTITYTPATNFNGNDAFSYTISDGQGGTASAAVSVSITPRNDAPLARADSATTPEGIRVIITVLANDTDPDRDVLAITAVTQGAHGTVTTNGTTITYTPAANYVGTDTFSYTVSDGKGGTAIATVSVTMTESEPVMLSLEAEEGLVQLPMEVDVDAAAPAVNYIWGPENTSDVWNAFLPGGFAHYTFEVPKTDTYVIWGRVSPNAAGTGSFFLAVDVEPEQIKLVSNLSPITYEVASLRVGETYYTDSTHTITAMPAALADLVGIKTANAYKKNKNARFLTFTINQNSTLYVAYDAQAASFPTWLTSYTKTGLTINTSNGPMAVWQKEVLAGNITIPGNRYQNAAGARNNYLVLLAPHGESSYLVWELADPLTPASWAWEQVASDTTPVFFLEAGVHTLTVKQRESGTKLDKILLTNDTEMVPQD